MTTCLGRVCVHCCFSAAQDRPLELNFLIVQASSLHFVPLGGWQLNFSQLKFSWRICPGPHLLLIVLKAVTPRECGTPRTRMNHLKAPLAEAFHGGSSSLTPASTSTPTITQHHSCALFTLEDENKAVFAKINQAVVVAGKGSLHSS